MTVYKNHRAESDIVSVEFSPVSSGNFSFFTLKSPQSTQKIRDWLGSAQVNQEVIAETMVDGHPILITHGDRDGKALLQFMNANGEQLEFERKSRPVNLWAVRGAMSVVGQSLQLSSAVMNKGGLDIGTLIFAVSNLAANGVNIMFGAQKTEDINRLRFLKTGFNKELGKHLEGGPGLPDVDEKRAQLRKSDDDHKTLGEKTSDFFRRYSVSVGEIGLRYLGVIGLAFPFKGKNWSKGMKALGRGELETAYKAMRNSDHGKANIDHYIGLAYLGGKTLALFSKTPDPYSDKPHTLLDEVREKYVFKASSIIEGLAAGRLAVDRFTRKKITIGGKTHADFLGGTGGMLFTAAFITRYFADFGKREVNQDELFAHVTDSLAQMPPEKLPQLMADAAATIQSHFKDKPMDFGEVFTQMMSDLYRYHHIALDNLGTEPEERLAERHDPLKAHKVFAKSAPAPSPSRQALAKAPAASHAERALSMGDAAQSHGPAML